MALAQKIDAWRHDQPTVSTTPRTGVVCPQLISVPSSCQIKRAWVEVGQRPRSNKGFGVLLFLFTGLDGIEKSSLWAFATDF